MTDFDLAVRRQLELLVPVTATAPDWNDVLARSGSPFWRRPLVLALAAALALVVTGVGIAAALGGFDRWLSGKPGKPAAPSDQALFRAANGRSWANFPTGTRLRQLIDTTIDGKRYELFGFRSGNELCLQLRADALGRPLRPACTPASMVAHLETPIVLVDGDGGLPDPLDHSAAEFSYGIVADGVTRVDVTAADGVHRAVVGGNAYLWAETRPNTGNRVTRITALGKAFSPVSLSVPPPGLTHSYGGPTQIRVPGPGRAEIPILHPTIGWYARHERRGSSIAAAKLTQAQRKELEQSDQGFTRLVKPDPLSNVVVGLSGRLCLVLVVVQAGPICVDTPKEFFSRGPFYAVSGKEPQGNAFLIAGAAADGIARVVIVMLDGQRERVPLRDNLFTALVPTPHSYRLVGYDAAGRVVGTEIFPGDDGQTFPPGALRDLHLAAKVTGPNGAVGRVLIGPVVFHGVRCWTARFSTGEGQKECVSAYPGVPTQYVASVQPAGHDLFVVGYMGAPAVSVRLRFSGGSTIRTRLDRGIFLFAIPRSHLSHASQIAFLTGYDAKGHAVLPRQEIQFRTNA